MTDTPAEPIRSPEAVKDDRPATDIFTRYQAAEAVLDARVMPLVLNESVAPNWVDDQAFWYRRQRHDGAEFIWVENGQARPAFDHAAAAAALGVTADPWKLVVETITADRQAVLHHEGRRWQITAGQAVDLGPVPVAAPGLLLSPAGDQALAVRGHDLHLVDLATGDERALTIDGEDNFAWGKIPDACLLAIARKRAALPILPFGWSWSPDGRFVVGGRVDERHIEPYPFLESVPQDGGARPRVHAVRQALVGEAGPVFTACAIEVATGRTIAIDLRAESGHDLGQQDMIQIEPIGWSDDYRCVFAAVAAHSVHATILLEIDIASGTVRRVIEEPSSGFLKLGAELYKQPNIRILAGGREAIWFSERSGYGHLYRYDLESGALLNPVTTGDWSVRDILRVDERHGRIYFTAAGREGGNPYERRAYRVDLDGRNLMLLSPEVADHTIDGPPESLLARIFGLSSPPSPISPDGSVFIDSWSTASSPGTTVLRSTGNGAIVATLETADASALFATGWRAPEPFVAKAADGETDLYGVLYRPYAATGAAAPVIDGIYGGPQIVVTPHNFAAARYGVGYHGRAALAALGFAVVVVDGRGTPLRSKAFHDAGYESSGDTCLDDHVAVLDQLCACDATLDRDRIGIYGHSAGGYTSARAILRHPDVFKVAFSSAGSHNFHGLYFGGGGPLPDYGEGQRLKPDVAAVPNNYRQLDNAVYAANLRGKLLLAYGDMDENAFPAVTLQLCDALTRANRRYDLLYIPNGTHFYLAQHYFLRRLWDYFIEHLMGEAPAADYAIGATGGMSSFA
ncbi:S9 family peptidase [Sphingomonas lycopersici]|uniref:S9 family peptidase n=1 Tax=Sphingomonas lycopersici TaxID=2951807 RepID=A0AA41ZH93_9SPHN|nr:S9 family peptidase [Sphingomonas lycopersici]MCW6536904.1 S9 family peptidase [Sphingomonas lycopersici]